MHQSLALQKLSSSRKDTYCDDTKMYKISEENVDLEVNVTILQNLCHPYCKKKIAKKRKTFVG